MTQNLNDLLREKNALIQKGQIVEATDRFFADKAKTFDFDGTETHDKKEMLGKMTTFAGAIKAVNGIRLHHSSANNHVTFSEFTFDFNMQDGSRILWHEIIRSIWENGKIVEEQYFKF